MVVQLEELRASGQAIRNQGDFVFMVINTREQDAELAQALRADIERQVNDGQEDRYFTIVNVDAADPESVRDVLSVVLNCPGSVPSLTASACLPGHPPHSSRNRHRTAACTGAIRPAVLIPRRHEKLLPRDQPDLQSPPRR
jgi:hypothetical protein